MNREHLTVDEIAGLLRVSRWTVMRYAKAGELDATKGPGRNGAVRITTASYDAFIQRNTVTARATQQETR